jgi:hypothetical protein
MDDVDNCCAEAIAAVSEKSKVYKYRFIITGF